MKNVLRCNILGTEPAREITGFLRNCGSPNAIAPSDWPDTDVRRWDDRGAVDSNYEAPRARWGHD